MKSLRSMARGTAATAAAVAAAISSVSMAACRPTRRIDVLKAAFVQGRLTKDEFGLRVDQAFASRTYADLAAITADIPAGPIAAQPAPKPARAQARPPVNAEVRTGVRATIVTTMVMAVLWVVAIFTDSGAAFIAAGGATGTVFVVSFLTGTRMLGSWLDNRYAPLTSAS